MQNLCLDPEIVSDQGVRLHDDLPFLVKEWFQKIGAADLMNSQG